MWVNCSYIRYCNVEERITTALFNADFSGGINKDNVKKYLEKRAL